MAVILVTGASGQLGNELKVTSKNYFGYEYIFTDVAELDITDSDKVREFIKINGPDWIINCAAFNSVDRAETEKDKAMLINGTSVRNITGAIDGTGCRLIHLSTDYVFDGASTIPYTEYSIPNPLSAYGQSKLAGEKVAMMHSGFMIIRTSWLYSSFGNNFVKTIMKIAGEADSVKVVVDQTGTPTYAADLAEVIMKIVAGVIRNQIAFNTGIYHYSNEGVCSWFDFAEAIIRDAGLECRVIPIQTAEYGAAAKRPAYSVLDKSKIRENYEISIPHWPDSLQKCINLIKKL